MRASGFWTPWTTIKKTALDPYATFRSLFRQHRESKIEETRNDNRTTDTRLVPPARLAGNLPRAEWSETAMLTRRTLLNLTGARRWP